MARQTAVKEINSFSKGIITEASPLTFPDNASIDEENLQINNDGSRKRRYGMDYEPNYAVVSTSQPITDDLAFSSYIWKSPGGYSEKEFIVTQTGTQVSIFDATSRPISGELIYTTEIGGSRSTRFSISSVDGILVIASNQANILTYDWNGSAIVPSSGRLKLRDFFGVEDIASGENLLQGNGVATRPSTLSQAHTYNLRNQTYAVPRYNRHIETLTDPIFAFFDFSKKYPANSDNVTVYLYADANDSDDRNTRRYFCNDNWINPLGTNRAPTGYFIIDALARGSSRITETQKLYNDNSTLQYPISSLPNDTTPNGARVVSSFAGRMWFGGFSSQLDGGDSQSPRMTSFILFSQLVKNVADIYKCYQEGDPTSSETPDLVDTDGGFIRLDGAYNIQTMVNVGDALMVIAENGVWRVTGGSGYGFKATDYLTNKITEHGCTAPDSIIVVDNTVMYWSDDGIYHLAPNQYGDWTSTNLTTNTIQSLFDGIDSVTKTKVQGIFDSYQRKARWLYNTSLSSVGDVKELVLDVNLGAFYKFAIKQPEGSSYPRPVSIVKVPPFTIGDDSVGVITLAGDSVITTTNDVVSVISATRSSSTSEIMYLTAVPPVGGNIRFTFSYYYNTSFKDWVSYDGVGVDASGFMLTGWTGFGDFQRQKQIPYLTVYSIKTETGFTEDFIPINSSSIKTQSQWAWTNSAEAGKWGPSFQAYRHNRYWTPSSSGDAFDDGEYVIHTRNKLRGRGNVVSLLFSTEPSYDFHLLGWSYLIGINGAP